MQCAEANFQKADLVRNILMKRLVLVGFVCGLAGFVLGNAFWYLASPLWIDREVSESLNRTEATRVLATGKFAGADAATGAGVIIRFSEFEVTNGPDLYVWLVRDGGITHSGDVKASTWLDLGILKGNIGDQNYSLPAGTDPSMYKTVVVWCKRFGVLFAAAEF
jgi:hypothetical protein